jgi:hypothetical protein
MAWRNSNIAGHSRKSACGFRPAVRHERNDGDGHDDDRTGGASRTGNAAMPRRRLAHRSPGLTRPREPVFMAGPRRRRRRSMTLCGVRNHRQCRRLLLPTPMCASANRSLSHIEPVSGMPRLPAADYCRPYRRRFVPFSCASLCAAGSRARRIRPTRPSPRPLSGCRPIRSSIDGDPSFPHLGSWHDACGLRLAVQLRDERRGDKSARRGLCEPVSINYRTGLRHAETEIGKWRAETGA